ncbi:MAG: hypothetical protein DRJ42_04900 [Deltaproteobacteria bacterium]|nr:MAG: hypothetical protein DRJ42_04900 [Deltaproteobacteria bacterium]
MGAESAKNQEKPFREARVSETMLRIDHAAESKALSQTRDQARSLRNQGWLHEMVGREAAFREAAGLVEKWLVTDTGPTKEGVAFVVELLEQSAALYSPRNKPKK